jgi:hypothetical protein
MEVVGDGATDRRGVVVLAPRGSQVEGAALNRDKPFAHERVPAVDQARRLGAMAERGGGDVRLRHEHAGIAE